MNLLYKQAEEKDIEAMHNLVLKVFDAFVAPNYIEEGNQEFYKYLDQKAIETRLENNHFIFLCKDQENIVGLIEVRNFNHISMLFVQANYQRKGIAKELLRKALEICKVHNAELKEVSVHSSPNSVAIYEKLGFVKTKEEQEINGIRFIPMVRKM